MQFVALRCVRRPRDGTGASEVVVFRKRDSCCMEQRGSSEQHPLSLFSLTWL